MVSLKYNKEYHPVEVSEYEKSTGIADDPSFVWWVPYKHWKRGQFVSAVNHRVGNITFKYGVEILITVDEALAVYNNFGNELCKKNFKRKYLMLVLLFKL